MTAPLARGRRARGPLGGHAALHAHQARLEQRIGDEAVRARRDRQAAEDFLVFDLLGAGGAHALHDEVEAIRAPWRRCAS